jgi:hypothetical protein
MQHLSSYSLIPCQLGLRHQDIAAIAALCIPRARHMDPKASSTRDSPPVACLAVQKHRRLVGVLDVAKRSPKGEQPGGACESKRRFAGGGNFREVGAGGDLAETTLKSKD